MKTIITMLFLAAIPFFVVGQSVTINTAINVTYDGATIRATGSSLNSTTTYAVQFRYSTDPTLATYTTVQSSNFTGGTTTVFTKDLSALSSGITYYYKARLLYYDSGDDFYYPQGSFTTINNFTTLTYSAPTVSSGAAASVSYTSMDIDGNNISSNGGNSIIEQGIVYSTTNNPPTISDTKVTYSPVGVGSYDVSMTGLSSNTTYYIRAFATNGIGTSYGSLITQATLSPSAPTVTLGTAFGSITANSASNSGNNATADNGAAITDKGIVYGTSTNPTSANSIFSTGTSGTGTFNASLTGLTQLTKYYARAFAVNSVGYGYSATEDVFTTIATTDAEITDMTSYAADELTITYNGGSGDGCIIYMRANNQVINPSNGGSYTANTAFESGTDIGSGTYVVYYGAASKAAVTVTNLDPVNDYYIRIATYSNNTGGPYFDVNDQGLNTADDSNLPVTLVAFAASSADNAVRLSWTTASEINNHFFAIEKSVDGLFFNEIGKIDGAGTSNVLNNYSFLDNEVAGERVFYRLRQVDFDGTESYSSVITVDTEKLGPAIDYLFADANGLNIIATTASANTQLIISDMHGKIIRNQNLAGSNSHQLHISTLNMPSGVYILSLNDGINKLTKKFVL